MPSRPYHRSARYSGAGCCRTRRSAPSGRRAGRRKIPAHSAGRRGCSSAPSAEDIDVELEHRVAEPVGRLIERPAGHRDIARDPPHGQEDRRHGRAIEQGEGARITRQSQCGFEVAPGVTYEQGRTGSCCRL